LPFLLKARGYPRPSLLARRGRIVLVYPDLRAKSLSNNVFALKWDLWGFVLTLAKLGGAKKGFFADLIYLLLFTLALAALTYKTVFNHAKSNK
jgi:hypothetical protein